MKKKFRILSLVLSFVLLFITAVPAFAAEYNEEHDELADEDNYPSPSASISLTSRHGNYTYPIELILQPDALRYHSYIEEAYYNPSISEDAVMEGWVAAGTKTWTASGWYDSTHRSALENIIDAYQLGIANTVSNRALYYSFTVDGNYAKAFYTVTLTCRHYKVTTTYVLNGDAENTDIFYHVPYVGGDFIYLDCPDF